MVYFNRVKFFNFSVFKSVFLLLSVQTSSGFEIINNKNYAVYIYQPFIVEGTK